MSRKTSLTVFVGSFVLALGSVAMACDGWHRMETKNRRYEQITLNAQQKAKIKKLKQSAIAKFSDDHRKGGCDSMHRKHVTTFVTEADGVLTNVQRMELRTTEKLQKMEREIAQLKREIRELKNMIRSLMKKQG